MIMRNALAPETAHRIFNECFPETALDLETFSELLEYNKCDVFSYDKDGSTVGFSAVMGDCIRLLCVLPEHSLQGIATQLLHASESHIKANGYPSVILGGFSSQLFIGAVTPSDEWENRDNVFFRKQGYSAKSGCIEMKLTLSDYSPEEFKSIAYPENVEIEYYSGDKAELYEAVASVDEEWVQYFRYDNPIIVARVGGKIASFAIVGYDDKNILSTAENRVGSVGCVGTVPEARKKGYGLAVVARATEELKNHGCDVSFIHFTYLEDWYGKLGYKTFLRYWFGSKKL